MTNIEPSPEPNEEHESRLHRLAQFISDSMMCISDAVLLHREMQQEIIFGTWRQKNSDESKLKAVTAPALKADPPQVRNEDHSDWSNYIRTL